VNIFGFGGWSAEEGALPLLAPVQGLTTLCKDTSPDSSTRFYIRLASTMALSQRHNSAGGPQILDQMKIRCGRHQIVEGNVLTV
jgi:hypothetical protein